MCGLGRVSSPVAYRLRRGSSETRGPGHVPFGPSVLSSFRLSFVTTFINASPELTLPQDPGSRPPCCWESRRRLASAAVIAFDEATLSRELRTPRFTLDARLGRRLPADRQVRMGAESESFLLTTHPYICKRDFVSHPNIKLTSRSRGGGCKARQTVIRVAGLVQRLVRPA